MKNRFFGINYWVRSKQCKQLLLAVLALGMTFYPLTCKAEDKKSNVSIDKSVYMDPKQPIDKRVEALLEQMTVEEKVGQMELFSIWDRDTIMANGYFEFGAWLADLEPEMYNSIQKLAERTRLKIPYLVGMDAAHGYAMLPRRTVFPTSISMAATFNRDLVHRAAQKSAEEIRSTGTNWTYAPSVDIVWDARWGRTGETYGEDPYLASELVKQAVTGLQGNLDPYKNIATSVKHLAGGGVSVGGINHASAELSERAFRSFILPPFKAAIEKECLSIMPGHNDVAGIPAHASHWLLTDVVKNEFGFKGFFISDMGDVENLTSRLHYVAETQKEAVELSVNAGLDMHMYSHNRDLFIKPLLELIKENKVSMERIDDAVRRILKVKFQLGLFEHPYVDINKDVYATAENKALALKAAQECIVLLKNENQILPLDKNKLKKILVTGPNADNQAILGDWSIFQPKECVTTILAGVRSAAPDAEVVFSNSGRIKSIASNVVINTTEPEIQKRNLIDGGGISDYSIADAVEKAKQCDLAIVAIGGYGLRLDWNYRTYGESADRPSIDFYGRQVELVQKIYETGTPVVVVIVNGKPLNNCWITEHIPAIVDVWEPGMYGGQALAEVLFGEINPSGKLPITIPKTTGQVPMYYYQKPSRYSTGYRLGGIPEDDNPAFCFGHGLSYTCFEYSDLVLDEKMRRGEDVKISFKVKNIGTRKGKETALLFVNDVISSVATPIALLKGFEKLELNPGEERVVELNVPFNELGLWNKDMKYVIEPGEFEFKVGRSFDDIRIKKSVYLKE